MAGDLKEFLELAKSYDFRNRDELLAGLESGEISYRASVTETTVSVAALLNIYERRAKHLAGYSSGHAKRMLEDVRDFVRNLRLHPGGEVRGWAFLKEPNVDYVVFEEVGGKTILGCVFGKDKRFTSTAEWRKLWQEIDKE